MSNSRHQRFRSFLTERFTAVAVEVYGEVEAIVEACYEENRRLRKMLHTVLSPEIKLHRIDPSQYTEETRDVVEQPPERNTQVDQQMSEPLFKKPKEEQIDYAIGRESEQQQDMGEADDFITPCCVKNEPEEDMHCIPDSFRIIVVDPESSAPLLDKEVNDELMGCSSLDSDAVTDCPQLSRSEERTSESRKHKKRKRKSKIKKKSKCSMQKTMLEFPRMMPHKGFSNAPTGCQSFLAKFTDAFKDLPKDKKPLITKMGLTADVELVDSAFGKVPKGCPLSYQYPMPSIQDYKNNRDAPPRPLLPLSYHTLKPMVTFPTLSAKEQEHVNVMQMTWEGAHSLERSTVGCQEVVEELQKLRLTSHFREICKLRPGQSHAEHLIFKIQKGRRRCKTLPIEEEWKNEALQVYYQNLYVNLYPCGLIVHPNAPWLGAKPDGLVHDPKEESSFGLVHVKFIRFQSFINCRFLVYRDGVLQLKRSHRYFWHIQGQMMVAGTTWCDLLVFSSEDILVQRIYRDKVFINRMKKKLDDFFFCHYLPSLFKTDVTP